MKKAHILPLLSLIAVCSVSCDSIGHEKKESVRFKLVADKTEIAPLQPVTVRLEPNLSSLECFYDKILFESEGSFWDGTIRLGAAYEKNKFQFTHYQQGTHKITARGYKDEKLISEDSIEFNVGKPTRDFMHINWGISQAEGFHYRPPLKKLEGEVEKYFTIDLNLFHSPEYKYNDGIEYAILQLTPWTISYIYGDSRSGSQDAIGLPDIYDWDWLPYNGHDREEAENNRAERNKFEYALLNGLITNNYGNPTLEFTGEKITETDLTEEYHKRFKYPLVPDFYPTNIWETPTSYICLIQNASIIKGKECRGIVNIIAEPRN